MTLKQAMKKMKVKEKKAFYFGIFGDEWLWVERLDSHNWIVERYLYKGRGYNILLDTYGYDEVENGLKILDEEKWNM